MTILRVIEGLKNRSIWEFFKLRMDDDTDTSRMGSFLFDEMSDTFNLENNFFIPSEVNRVRLILRTDYTMFGVMCRLLSPDNKGRFARGFPCLVVGSFKSEVISDGNMDEILYDLIKRGYKLIFMEVDYESD